MGPLQWRFRQRLVWQEPLVVQYCHCCVNTNKEIDGRQPAIVLGTKTVVETINLEEASWRLIVTRFSSGIVLWYESLEFLPCLVELHRRRSGGNSSFGDGGGSAIHRKHNGQ